MTLVPAEAWAVHIQNYRPWQMTFSSTSTLPSYVGSSKAIVCYHYCDSPHPASWCSIMPPSCLVCVRLNKLCPKLPLLPAQDDCCHSSWHATPPHPTADVVDHPEGTPAPMMHYNRGNFHCCPGFSAFGRKVYNLFSCSALTPKRDPPGQAIVIIFFCLNKSFPLSEHCMFYSELHSLLTWHPLSYTNDSLALK